MVEIVQADFSEEELAASEPYIYGRAHECGFGQWCVRGPGVNFLVPSQILALAIGKLLSGKTEEAAAAAASYIKYVGGRTVPDMSWPQRGA